MMTKGQIMQLAFDRWLSNAAVGPFIAAGLVAIAVWLSINAGAAFTATAAG
jgi:hypothetical protein